MKTALTSLLIALVVGCIAIAQPMVVCTTTIIGDVVSQIAGEAVEVRTLLPVGADPHTFEATPQDLILLSEAAIIFSNGAELEASLEPALKSVGTVVIELAEGLDLLPIDEGRGDEHHDEHEEEGHHDEEAGEHEEDEHHDDEDASHDGHEDDHEHGEFDPHVWLDPIYVVGWTRTIERELVALAPDASEAIAVRANAYRGELIALDAWVKETVAEVPADRRNLVTDHLVFAYFAARYGFTQAGAVLPSVTTASDTSAQELAELIDTIRALDVRVIFTGDTVTSSLLEQVARDTGTQLVFLYIPSLSGPDGPAANYLDFIRYDVRAMVDALIASP